MQCRNCGANLRDTALFCNKCGQRVRTATKVSAATRQLSPDDDAPAPGRVQRPSRPLRAGDGYSAAAPISRPLEQTPPGAASAGAQPAAPYTSPNAREMVSQSPTAPSLAAQHAISDMPTTEMAAATSPVPEAVAPDQLPWPLPVGQTLLGRFQIVSLVESQPYAVRSQNVYHVIDLQGYLHCWSCGADYDHATASERFCPNCGADMLGHEYLMTERREPQSDETRVRIARLSPTRMVESFTAGERSYDVTSIPLDAQLFPDGPHISAAGMSHVGLTRAGDTNEDCFGALAINLAQDSHVQPVAIGIVADGLGGHANGQEASRLATRTFMERLTHEFVQPFLLPMGGALPPSEAVVSALREAVAAANAAVYDANVQGMGDMGSTLVAAMIVGDEAWIANVGDSRAYALGDDGLRRVSIDHSLVEQLIVSGMITPEERYTHSQRNRIFRSLGGDPTVEVDIFTQKLTPGMMILLCSDGMWEMTRDPDIETILLQNRDPRDACQALIASANKNGGEDNITVVLLRADA